MPKLIPPSQFWKNQGQGWRPCVLCGTLLKRVEVDFDDGGVEPTVGETVTGATSGDTGIITEVVLYSGSYAAGDAAGVIVMSTYTGDASGVWGQADENLNGSTAGDDFATTMYAGAVKKSGMMYPTNQMVRIDGKWYCKPHASMVSASAELDLSRYVPDEVNDEP